jgi:Flp pilus assembly protein TadB
MINLLDGTDPNLLVAIAAMLVIIICCLAGLLVYLIILRPKLKIRRRILDLGLLVNITNHTARSTANARQLRIQDKLQELEEKGNRKRRRTEIRTKLLQAGLDISVRRYFRDYFSIFDLRQYLCSNRRCYRVTKYHSPPHR